MSECDSSFSSVFKLAVPISAQIKFNPWLETEFFEEFGVGGGGGGAVRRGNEIKRKIFSCLCRKQEGIKECSYQIL